ncbi:hypothetical protein D3P08_07090 [Paenibacillus nanensis]|uniref:Uncharacterized protein n=1 Tax=Paenibacillus nanensis TaxID=393251 RepID=A0A3A1V9B0_9BACL|nr:hypothetical protein [Paenibacillus nanensis]RIX54010.1 hypothetical protein D3P08_07090 [Paenibacillus nanensis]
MFDPTIFDNLKVAIENEFYDLDNLDRIIDITGRKDLLDMAVMSREFSLFFRLAKDRRAEAELVLETSLRDLAAEILERPEEQAPACGLKFRFRVDMDKEGGEALCQEIERCIMSIWLPDNKPMQTLSHVFGDDTGRYRNCIELGFGRRIGEEQMDDIPELAKHAVLTLEALCGLMG